MDARTQALRQGASLDSTTLPVGCKCCAISVANVRGFAVVASSLEVRPSITDMVTDTIIG